MPLIKDDEPLNVTPYQRLQQAVTRELDEPDADANRVSAAIFNLLAQLYLSSAKKPSRENFLDVCASAYDKIVELEMGSHAHRN